MIGIGLIFWVDKPAARKRSGSMIRTRLHVFIYLLVLGLVGTSALQQ